MVNINQGRQAKAADAAISVILLVTFVLSFLIKTYHLFSLICCLFYFYLSFLCLIKSKKLNNVIYVLILFLYFTPLFLFFLLSYFDFDFNITIYVLIILSLSSAGTVMLTAIFKLDIPRDLLFQGNRWSQIILFFPITFLILLSLEFLFLSLNGNLFSAVNKFWSSFIYINYFSSLSVNIGLLVLGRYAKPICPLYVDELRHK